MSDTPSPTPPAQPTGPAPDVRVLAQGRFLRLVQRGRWEFVERTRISGIVGVVAVTPDRHLVLIEHFNLPFNRTAIELPAGLVGDVAGQEGEALPDAAIRELMEETGYQAHSLTFLATAATSCGLTNEQVHLFRAVGLTKVGEGGGVDGEDITVRLVPLDDAPQWLAQQAAQGCVIDMKIYAALHFARATA